MDFTLSNYKDVDDTVMPLIIQYYRYFDAGDLANANKILEDNADLLKPYRLDMNGINKIEKVISDLADIAFSTQQIIISNTEPTGASFGVGTEWYQPY